jgi:hypothetical protein
MGHGHFAHNCDLSPALGFVEVAFSDDGREDVYEGGNAALLEFVQQIRNGETVYASGDVFLELLQILASHHYVDVIVPGNEAAVPY